MGWRSQDELYEGRSELDFERGMKFDYVKVGGIEGRKVRKDGIVGEGLVPR